MAKTTTFKTLITGDIFRFSDEDTDIDGLLTMEIIRITSPNNTHIVSYFLKNSYKSLGSAQCEQLN